MPADHEGPGEYVTREECKATSKGLAFRAGAGIVLISVFVTILVLVLTALTTKADESDLRTCEQKIQENREEFKMHQAAQREVSKGVAEKLDAILEKMK